jgi:RHS repeat-associated protein
MLLVVDPLGMSPLVTAALADGSGDGDLSRAERVDAVVAGLDLPTPVAATDLTGSWGSLPGSGDLDAPAVSLPTEDEKIVDLSGGGTGPVSYLRQSQLDEQPAQVDLGGMAVAVAPADADSTPDAVKLHVADQTDTQAAGVTGVLLDVTDASTDTIPDPEVKLTVSYADFAGLGGAGWASRLRIMWIPDCTTETVDCSPVPLDTTNDTTAQTVTATVPVGAGDSTESASLSVRKIGGGAVSETTGGGSGGSLAVTAGASSSSGNWGATSLSQSATWGAGGSTGAFSWSLPFTTPPVSGGPSPSLSLSYSSAGSDGRTPATNNQSGLLGEGFSLTSAYVERTYTPCMKDETGSANNLDRLSADLCWGTDNATLVFNGTAVELVKDSTGAWHGKNEDGSLIEKLSGAWNGGQANEYWKVTTTDGTQYFFGRGQRSASDTTPLNSAWTVPVYGNHPGEPCYHADFSDSRCDQVWRWNLDYVVDASGNTMTYTYSKEANKYVYDLVGNADGSTASYTSGGRLDSIEYGTRAGTESTTSAPAKVTFTTSPRCITDLGDPESFCNSSQTSTSSNYWLDTPTDLVCESADPCTNITPVFFDRYRLNKISTFAYDGSAYQPVDSWSVQQRFVGSGTGGLEHAASPMLITTGVTHTGQNGTTTTSDDITLPENQFGYTYLDNRVDSTADGADPIRRPRVTDIRTESGASITVTYRTECTASDQPGTSEAAQAANTRLCYPVKWTQSDSAGPVVDYFHKYVVETIVESGAPPVGGEGSELITGSVAKQTTYTYNGGAAWVKPTGAMVDPSDVTYSDFRGFGEVVSTLGVGSESSSTRNEYYRGLGGTLTAGPAGYTITAQDRNEYNGQVFDTVQLDGTTPVAETVSVPGAPIVTATDTAGRTASRIPSTSAHGFSYGADGSLVFRTGTTTTFDANSQPVTVENLGDLTNASDNVCTTITYAHTSDSTLESKHLVSQASRTDTVAGACSDTPDLPGDLISSATTTYDEDGRPLRSESIDPHDGVGYVLTSEVLEYDAWGRPLRVADALGQVSTASYQESAGGLPLSSTYTTPGPGFTSTTVFNPLTGAVVSSTDLNGRVTSGTRDALGRLLTVRYPQDQGSPVPSVQYEYTMRDNGLNAVITKSRGADGVTQHASVTLYDGLLRPFQTQVEGADAGADHNANADERGRMVAQTYYDSAGRVSKQTGQWWATGVPQDTPVVPIAVPPSQTTTDYDAAGRPVAQVFWVGTDSNPANEKWRTTTSYDGATTLTIPPMGGTPQSTTVDASGRVVELRQYLRDPDIDTGADTPAEVLALPHQSTTYTYDAAGQRTGMRDTVGNEWTYHYDWSGRLISSADPDAGTSTTTYDAMGRVATHTDANNDTLAYTYDALGRAETMRDGSASGPIRVQWTYDQSTDPDNQVVLGQLSSATRYVDGNAYTTSVSRYDFANRPLATTVTLPDTADFASLDSRSFTTGYSYAADGQVSAVSLPAVKSGGVTRLGSEVVTTHFDSASMPSWMSGGFGWGTYVAESRFTADGRPLVTDLGNTYGAITSYRYEDGTNRLVGVALDREGFDGADVDIHYGYDAAGNVTSMKDQPTAAAVAGPEFQDNQCFGYDGLQRLSVAWTAGNGDCSVAQSAIQTSDVGGVSPYWSEYEYDPMGNRTQLVEHGTDGSSTTTTDYEYGGGSAGPHQLTSLTETGGTTAQTDYTYDYAGNRVSAGSTDYTWDAEGHLSAVAGESNVYDAAGNRLVHSDASGTTVYLPGGQQIHIDGSTVRASRYYSFAGSTVAVRTGSGLGAVTSLVSDQHGTTVAAVPNTVWTASSVKRVFSDPFGAVRGGSDAGVPGDRRFLGAVLDAGTGLTLLGARYYDAVVGAFISVDPVLNPGNPAQFNAYD